MNATTPTENDMYEPDDFTAAKDALMSAAHRDRPAVTALLAKYGATELPDLRVRDLVPFARECNQIQAPPMPRAPSCPPIVLTPKFNIGERVHHKGSIVSSIVSGFELRYVLQNDGKVQYFGSGIREDKLERPPPPACPPPPALPFVYLREVEFGHIVERYSNKVAYFVSSRYDGTAHRVLTTLRGGVPKPDVSQDELVRDLGPASVAPPAPPAQPADFGYNEWYKIGSALDDVNGYSDRGELFMQDGKRLIAELDKSGFRVVRK